MTTAASPVEMFYGLIQFDASVSCTKDALGCKATVVIGGVTGMIELPSPAPWGPERPDDPLHVPLTPPPAAASWKDGDRPMLWGVPIHYPNGWGRVERALLTFELPHEEMRTLASSIHQGFTRWYKLFDQYFELITRQRSFSHVEVEPYPSQLDLFRCGGDGKADRPYDTGSPSLSVFTSNTDELLLKREQFVQICALASSLKDPALPYQIQLEAYRAARNGDYRKALVETGAAAELGLASAAREMLTTSRIGYTDELMKRFQSLGGKLALARIVGVPLPAMDYKARLVTPRNGVIHRGNFAERSVALDAIKVTDELLGAICTSLHDAP